MILSTLDQRRLATPGSGPGSRRATTLVERARRARELVAAGASSDAVTALLADAERAMQRGPWTVTDKAWLPDGADRHDYVHVAPYAWPNDDPDAPWELRDGHVNPATAQLAADGDALRDLSETMCTLALASVLCDDDTYRARALQLARVWFCDPDTAMRPSLEHAVHVPGLGPTGWGLARLRPMLGVLDSLELLRCTGTGTGTELDPEFDPELGRWTEAFLAWLCSSDLYAAELARGNNHATIAVSLALALALYTDDPLADELVAVADRVVEAQVAPDGSQPAERSRPRSLYYCGLNLAAMLRLRDMCAAVSPRPDHDPARRALEHHLGYLIDPTTWAEPGPEPSDLGRHGDVLVRAVAAWPEEPRYRDALRRSSITPPPRHRIWLELGLAAPTGSTATPPPQRSITPPPDERSSS